MRNIQPKRRTDVFYHRAPTPKPSNLSLLSGYLGGAVDQARGKADRVLNQSINLALGRLDTGTIIKFCIIMTIILGIAIIGINAIRWTTISTQQVSCSGGNFLTLGIFENDCSESAMPAYELMWDIEWYLRCILYLFLALITWILTYHWFIFIADKLMRIQYYIDKLENWIFGFKWDGEADEVSETRF